MGGSSFRREQFLGTLPAAVLIAPLQHLVLAALARLIRCSIRRHGGYQPASCKIATRRVAAQVICSLRGRIGHRWQIVSMPMRRSERA